MRDCCQMSHVKSHRINPKIRQRSRELRKNLTPAERKLWNVLRNRNLGNFKFRRQHPIGSFIADFYCAEVKLVIEVDGGIHAFQKEYDEMRTAWLEERGYHVVRFQNEEVLSNITQVANEILTICERLKKVET